MEVHHHAHHDGSKNWKSYFWEFLMLFIAVFCGFLAENAREHIVEHEREIQYVKSLLQDLKQDTITLSQNIKTRESRKFYSSSLIDELSTPIKSDSLKSIYFNANRLTALQVFNYSNSTIQQLKNSGLMRLIRNPDLVNSINAYDLLITRHKLREQVELDMNLEYNKAICAVFNANTLIHMNDSVGNASFTSGKGSSDIRIVYIPLLTNDPDKINLVKGLAAMLYNRNNANYLWLFRFRKEVTNIIDLINKEYQLE
jgi:hypothetical protein